tara:strand:- start:85 stop:606 length:522 start_codon:yes stop_codon:yes gene_type:complete
MQTTRHRNQVLIFTCPNFANLDAGARGLVHVNIITKGIDFKNNISYFSPYFLQVNTRTGKAYFKYMRFKERDKSFKTKLKQIGLKLPTDEMIEEYEKIKTGYTTKLNETILNDGVEPNKPKDKKQIDRKTYFKLKKLVGDKEASELLKISESSRKRLNKEEEKLNKKDIGGNH